MSFDSVYFDAMRAVIIRQHRRRFSVVRLRLVCSCGGELPCDVRWHSLASLQRQEGPAHE